MRLTRILFLSPLLLATLGCAPQASTATDGTTAPSATSTDPAACAQGKTLTDGTLTIGTDSPAYDPWFSHDDPTNGKGFESAVAYAVAQKLGFSHAQVTWVKVPFNSSYAPGPKKFDFDINQISITPARAQVVDFSDGYYSAAQAVITVKGSKAEGATSFADLQSLKIGAQTGTTSLTAIRDEIKPSSDAVVFKNTNDAKQALLNGQVDAIVADLPTAFYLVAAEIDNGTIVGQFQPTAGQQEEFGMLFAKGNDLVSCVDAALADLKGHDELQAIEKKWLSDTVDVPTLQ